MESPKRRLDSVDGFVLQNMGESVSAIPNPFDLRLILLLGLVLFHAAFVALKLRCPLTLNVNPSDFNLTGEMKLFQGYAPPLIYLGTPSTSY